MRATLEGMAEHDVIAPDNAQVVDAQAESMRRIVEELRPPESWPGAGGRKSVAPDVASWPGQRPRSSELGGSWPGAASSQTGKPVGTARQPVGTARPRPRDPGELVAELTARSPKHHVSRAARGMWMLGALLGWVLPLLTVCAWMLLDPATRPAQLTAFGLVVVLAGAHLVLMPLMRYRLHRWEITPDLLYVQTGWLTRTRTIIGRDAIRAVETSAGPLARVFGLSTVTVRTESGPARVVRIDGLGPSSCAHVRDTLTPTS